MPMSSQRSSRNGKDVEIGLKRRLRSKVPRSCRSNLDCRGRTHSLNMSITPRHKRRIASDKAHAWARSVPLDNPYGKTVLRALTLYVNGEGCCFVGLDQLSSDTDLSVDTVRRRLLWLERVGAIVRIPQWIDSNGRRNGDGKGKRTTDEIRLLIDADLDEIERLARGENSPS